LTTSGFKIQFLPILEFEYENLESLNNKLLSFQFYGIIFTSSRAVLSLSQLQSSTLDGILQSREFFFVGKTTKDLFQARFPTISSSHCHGEESGNATNLAEFIVEFSKKFQMKQPLLFLCGNKRRDELPNLLTREKINFEEIVVYKSKTNTADIEKMICSSICVDYIVFFSPSGVEAFTELENWKDKLLTSKIGAIGPTTADALTQRLRKPDFTCVSPTPEALLIALQQFCHCK
jgi:uroporphyrinogen-III synthase